MGKYFIDGREGEFCEGDKLIDIAMREQKNYEHDIVLFTAKGRIKELAVEASDGMELKAVTTADRIGMDCYRRSALFLFMKTVYDLAGFDRIEKVKTLYSIGSSLYIEVLGDVSIDGEFAKAVKEKMREYVRENMPVKKRAMATDDAIALFEGYKMYDKRNLLEFRSASAVNIYSIGRFEDYYFGAMVYSTGVLKYFDVLPYEGGLLLNLPLNKEPEKIPEFVPKPKLFAAFKEASSNFKKMKVETVADLNLKIVKGTLPELILTQETLMERKIAETADKIAERQNVSFVLIAGPSSSGKTTFSRRLAAQFMAMGLSPHTISLDDYYLSHADMPRDENGETDKESIEAIDLELFKSDMERLLGGERIELPSYNFKTGKREYRGRFTQLGENDIFVIEGIHGLNDRLSEGLPEESKFKIYISPIIQLNIDERNRVPTTDGRLIRRIVRDAKSRGTDAKTTIGWWPEVRKGEEKNIFPYQESADVIFNSAHVYELAALKVWAEPLLHAVPKGCPEYAEAKRLLKFFNYFLSIDNDNIPTSSLVREFIGGSCFDVG